MGDGGEKKTNHVGNQDNIRSSFSKKLTEKKKKYYGGPAGRKKLKKTLTPSGKKKKCPHPRKPAHQGLKRGTSTHWLTLASKTINRGALNGEYIKQGGGKTFPSRAESTEKKRASK